MSENQTLADIVGSGISRAQVERNWGLITREQQAACLALWASEKVAAETVDVPAQTSTMSSNPFRDRLAQLPKPAHRIDADRAPFPVRPVAMISERQRDYALDLLLSKDLTAERRPKFQARMCELAASRDLTGLTAEQASALIDALLSLPSNRFPREQAVDVPAGHYALDKVDGGTMFVKVDRPESGKWAGYTFVSLQVSDELVRMPRNQQAAVLDAIRADGPREAAIRYGHELGVCAVCSRTLTNDESRAAGIGPVCRDKAGW